MTQFSPSSPPRAGPLTSPAPHHFPELHHYVSTVRWSYVDHGWIESEQFISTRKLKIINFSIKFQIWAGIFGQSVLGC